MMDDPMEDREKGGDDNRAELRLETPLPASAADDDSNAPQDQGQDPVQDQAAAVPPVTGPSGPSSPRFHRLFPLPDRGAQAARNRWLPEGRRGPMPWIIAIMMFLTILAGAIGLSLGHALTQLHGTLAGGHTVQIVEPNAEHRAGEVRRVAAMLRGEQVVRSVRIVPENELLMQLEPWIGTDVRPDELPVPALIDIEAAPGASTAQIDALRRKITAIAPSARMDAHESYMGPIERLMRLFMWVAAGAVALMVLVTWAVVMLAARSAHATHRATIDIMHLLGATDLQIARLFQRRMALDAIFGSLLGSLTAGIMLWVLHRSVLATEAELAHMMTLPWQLAIALTIIPLSAVLLAMLTARITVRRTLERTL